MEIEERLTTSKPVVVAETVQPEMNLTLKQVNETELQANISESVDPMNQSFNSATNRELDDRRRKMKDFNYKFSSNKQDELEKIPAYKRSGVELNNNIGTNSNSRTSLGTDSNNDNQLRSNNSFLHDSVD